MAQNGSRGKTPRSTREVDLKTRLALAQGLLHPGEEQVPPEVQRTIAFLSERGVWFQLSRNPEARSCRDAAAKRTRLGHQGIPLWAEMKSYFGTYADARGKPELFVAHCRADRRLDLERLRSVVGARDLPRRLTDEELLATSTNYGLVNPFGLPKGLRLPQHFTLDPRFIESQLQQIFDEDLIAPLGVPETVMTNAGSLTWAVEFDAADLVARIENKKVASIAEPDPESESRVAGLRKHRAIGILSGSSPEVGNLLWTLIGHRVRALLGPHFYGDVSMPPVVVHSLPELGLATELAERSEKIEEALRSAAEGLCREGRVKIVALPCHALSFYAKELQAICEQHAVSFISLPQVTGDWIRRHGIGEITLVGEPCVGELGQWSAYRQALEGIHVEVLSQGALEKTLRLAYCVKMEGPTEAGLNTLRDLLNREVGTKHVLLASNELSLLLHSQRRPGRGDRVLVDPLPIYADAVAEMHLFG
jgi:aspartate/glutamate racemase/prolyl-tRNA editing enzyme YbaK/EbsC (Cys-tRNA(Pro) deacylase)